MVILKHNSLNPEIFFNAIFFPYFSGSMFFRVQVFQSSCFSGSRFFRVQVFQGPGYSGSGLFRVQVFQGPGPGFRSSTCISILSKYTVFRNTNLLIWEGGINFSLAGRKNIKGILSDFLN